jgi:hypothetical protein
MLLRYAFGWNQEAAIVEEAVRIVLESTASGGYGLRSADLGGDVGCRVIGEKVCEVVRDKLGELAATEYWTSSRPEESIALESSSRGMTLCEKILAHHAVGLKTPILRPGQMVCVKVDWTLASELTWKGMDKTYSEMGTSPLL